jgi:hypothetical protein
MLAWHDRGLRFFRMTGLKKTDLGIQAGKRSVEGFYHFFEVSH